MARSELQCYLFSTSTKLLSQGEMRMHKMRGKQTWIGDKVETEVLNVTVLTLVRAHVYTYLAGVTTLYEIPRL
jgi:hypothetical protein